MPEKILTELFDSRACSVEKNGRRTLRKIFLVPEGDPARAVLWGPPYGCLYAGLGVYVKSKAVEPVDDTTCRLTVIYESPDAFTNPPLDYVFWDVDLATQTTRIYSTSNAEARKTFPPGEPEYEESVAINEDSDGNIGGVDILVPKVELAARVLRTKKYWSNLYQETVYGLVAKVNKKTFMGFAPGEVLFVGCQKQDSGEQHVQLAFKFLCEKNVSGQVMPTATSAVSVAKKGWEYLWPRIGPVYDSTTKKTLWGKPLCYHVDELYASGDFTALGLGEEELTDDTDYGIL